MSGLSEQQLAEIRSVRLLELMSERSAGRISGYLAVLLAEVERLKAENATAEDRVREAVAQDFIRQGKASNDLNWGQAVVIAREGLCSCSGGIKPCDMAGDR